ncbi:aldo/keto reductase [Rhodopirellula sp. MGV]|uniref:aldo/keto reductase n=1 Tax=Rhodopirellula sp. MGV TaxID=2023130 RepID=UPI000B9676AC|nr:aldo/keto reductase [Rhodopirellula sp. MGV]OYP31147.1 4-dihydromethyl-trisporate dehydrogenase [Rhodopirellula sp. MGV]PNY36029.1 aldo/keto reductase [Rhodopirellula baltica]
MSDVFPISGGDKIPAVGLGIWKIDPSDTAQVVRDAIEIGYRHIDAACDYGNEVEAGKGIQAAIEEGLVKREDLWVTSKLWNTYHRPEHVRPALEKSLADLGLDYLDLYHIHFPISLAYVAPEKRYPPGWFFEPDAENPAMKEDLVPIIDTWNAMIEQKTSGLVRNIGVCNFGVSLIRDLIASSSQKPSVLQIELHPYLTQQKLLRYCAEQDIHVTGFSPLGAQSYYSIGMAEQGEGVIDREETKSVAAEVGRTPAQVVMRWAIQRGTSIVPKTSKKDRLRENLALFDFELNEKQMENLTSMNQDRRFNDPGDFGEKAFNTFYPIYE